MLVLDQVLKEEYGPFNEQAATHRQLAALELAGLGMTHAEVTGFLSEQWKLPPLLSVPMKHHHDPQSVEDAQLRKLTDVGYVAGLCADVFVDANPAEALAEVRSYCADRFKLSEADCDVLLSEIGNRTKEIAPLFEIKLGKASDFDEVLKRANEALVELTLRTQQQSANLEQQNLKLQQQASTDALTGLANRARFDQFLAEQVGQSLAQRRPISLLMLDVDTFKNVNDTHGHPAGDHVLKVIGKLLRTAARATDLAARYGGDELTLVLPGTGKSTAAAIAESIRRTVAAKPIQWEKQGVSATVSVGVATLEAESPLKQAAHLLKAADLALYAAKHGGRNCVKVFSLPAKAA
jgi:diguanylate cyclase (GGDEF)-like protein